MRNLQIGPDDSADILAELVKRITYKPGWALDLQECSRGQGCEGLTLRILGTVPHSLNPAVTVGFLHLFPVPPAAYGAHSWERWVLDCILKVEQHEALEFYAVDGERPYFPEHRPGVDPYEIRRIGTKTQTMVDEPAVPYNGGPPRSGHFA